MTTAFDRASGVDALAGDFLEIKATLAIQKLVASYSVAVDSGRRAEWVALWTEDAEFDETETGTGHHIGREAIDSFFGWIESNMQSQMHFGGPHVININAPGHATGRQYSLVEGITKAGHSVRCPIYYDDEYREIDGKWLFKRRKVYTLMPPVLPGLSHD